MQKMYGILAVVILAASAFGDDQSGKKSDSGNAAPVVTTSQHAQTRSVRAYRNLQGATGQRVVPQGQIGSANSNQQSAAFQLNRNFNRGYQINRHPVNTPGTTAINRVDAADNILSNLQARRQHQDRGEQNAQMQSGQVASGNAGNFRRHGGNRVIPFNNENTQSFHQARQWEGAGRRHDANWWRSHCRTVIFIGGGYYGWNAGYWYPAFGYDDSYGVYASADPIYGYDGLPPDQVIANVQSVLQELGYFNDAVDGVLGPDTRAALANYQRDAGLFVSAAVDRPTLVSLGFIG